MVNICCTRHINRIGTVTVARCLGRCHGILGEQNWDELQLLLKNDKKGGFKWHEILNLDCSYWVVCERSEMLSCVNGGTVLLFEDIAETLFTSAYLKHMLFISTTNWRGVYLKLMKLIGRNGFKLRPQRNVDTADKSGCLWELNFWSSVSLSRSVPSRTLSNLRIISSGWSGWPPFWFASEWCSINWQSISRFTWATP